MLSSLSLPVEVVDCSDMLCKSHENVIVEYMEDIINAIKLSAELTIPKNKNNIKSKRVPGWNRHVKFYKKKALFWNDVWKSAGSPSIGELFSIRKQTRSNYHKAVNHVKKNKDKIIKEEVAMTLKNKSKNEFWKYINKIKLKDKVTTNVMDDVVGKSEITNVFYNKYSNIYSEFKDDEKMIVNHLGS